jgi:hypothetical protein
MLLALRAGRVDPVGGCSRSWMEEVSCDAGSQQVLIDRLTGSSLNMTPADEHVERRMVGH